MREVPAEVIDFKPWLFDEALSLVEQYDRYCCGNWHADSAALRPIDFLAAATEMVRTGKRLVGVLALLGLSPLVAREIRGRLDRADAATGARRPICQAELPELARLARASAQLQERIERLYGAAA